MIVNVENGEYFRSIEIEAQIKRHPHYILLHQEPFFLLEMIYAVDFCPFDFVKLHQIGINNWELSFQIQLSAICKCTHMHTFVCTVNLSCVAKRVRFVLTQARSFLPSRWLDEEETARRSRVAQCIRLHCMYSLKTRGAPRRRQFSFDEITKLLPSRHLPSLPPSGLLQTSSIRYSALKTSRRDCPAWSKTPPAFSVASSRLSIWNIPELNPGNQEKSAGASARRDYFL